MTVSIKTRALIFFAVLVSIYFLVFSSIAKFEDTAIFGGDAWEYQSIAVNFAKGHGIQKFGGMEPFETYKFESLAEQPSYYQDFFDLAGKIDYVRTPAYPFFLGVIYRLFGISPSIAKAIQLLLLVIIAAALPFIGYNYWGKLGFYGGIPAGAFYLAINYKFSEYILTESLITFSIFLMLIAFIFYEKQKGILSICLLGVSLGYALLVKGSLIFLPIFIWGIILVEAIKKNNPEKWRLFFLMVLTTLLTVFPWSLYASSESGQFIFLSIQGSTQILDDNNELCIDGGWHPEWVNNKNALYNNDGIDNSRTVTKVANFYLHNPLLLPHCLAKKFIRGFGPLTFFWIFIGLLALDGALRMLNKRTNSEFAKTWVRYPEMQIPISFWVVIGNFLLITLIFHGEAFVTRSRLVAPMDFILALLGCVSVLRFLSITSKNLRTYRAKI